MFVTAVVDCVITALDWGLAMERVTDQQIKDFQVRIETGQTAVADVDLFLLIIKQVLAEATGNAPLS